MSENSTPPPVYWHPSHQPRGLVAQQPHHECAWCQAKPGDAAAQAVCTAIPVPPAPPPPTSKRLSLKEQRFVEEHLVDGNATQAAIRAGYSAKSASSIGYELRHKPRIADAIDRRARELAAEVDLRPSDIVRAIARQVNRDTRQLFHPDGRHKAFHELSEEQASWLAGYEVVIKNAEAGDGHTDRVIKIKLNDLAAYVKMGGEHFGMFEEKVTHTASDGLLEALAEGRRRIAERHPRHAVPAADAPKR